MNDTLLNRYLQAIGKYLPEASRADTLAELRANLLERIDAREEQLGRPLTDAEVAPLLRELGKPEAVALRYLPQRSLIGPEVFPFYEYTLRKLTPLVLLAYTLARGVTYATMTHFSLRQAMENYAAGLVTTAFSFFASITIVFAVLDRLRGRADVRERLSAWDPSKLPRVEPHTADPSTWSTVKRVLDLSVHCLWFAYVLWFPWHPFSMLGPGVFYFGKLGLALAPVWHTFYLLLVVLLSVQLVIKVLAFLPSLTRAIKAAELGTNLLGLASLGVLAQASVLFVAANTGANAQQIATINQSMGLAFRIVFLITAFGFLKSVWGFTRQRTQPRQFAF